MKYNNWDICARAYRTTTVTENNEVVEVNFGTPSEFYGSQIQVNGEDKISISTPTIADNKNGTVSVMTDHISGSNKNIVFSLDEAMRFGDNDSHNGYVSFAFFNDNGNFDFNSDRPLPANSTSLTYDSKYLNRTDANKADKTGGIAPWFWNNENIRGFTLTLFPDKDGEDSGTKNVSYYKISIKNRFTGHQDLLIPEEGESETILYNTDYDVITYEDKLPEKIDLGKVTSLSINIWRDDYVRILLNGMELISFILEKNNDLTVYDTFDVASTRCNMIMSCMCGKGFQDNIPTKAGFNIYSINGISAYDVSTNNN